MLNTQRSNAYWPLCIFFYIDKVYHGQKAKSDEMEWFLPEEKQSYTYTDSLIIDPSLKKENYLVSITYWKTN
jgi:carbonic anhydrase